MKYQALFFSSLCLILSSTAFAQDNGMLDSDRNPATRSPASVETKVTCTDKDGGSLKPKVRNQTNGESVVPASNPCVPTK